MTYTTAERRIVLPEWVMPYLLTYGSQFDCDDLPTIVCQIIAEHKRAGIALSVNQPGIQSPELTTAPAAIPARFKLN